MSIPPAILVARQRHAGLIRKNTERERNEQITTIYVLTGRYESRSPSYTIRVFGGRNGLQRYHPDDPRHVRRAQAAARQHDERKALSHEGPEDRGPSDSREVLGWRVAL